MSENKKEVGKRGEMEAASFLKLNNYEILDMNYRTRFGEIDMVAKENDFLVFVEVKKRGSLNFGEPEFSITPTKQKHIIKTALCYLKDKKIKNRNIRFDVVIITPNRKEIIKNAISVSSH